MAKFCRFAGSIDAACPFSRCSLGINQKEAAHGKLVLSFAEEEQLLQLIRPQSTPQGLAQRARVVQLAAQGLGVRAIGPASRHAL